MFLNFDPTYLFWIALPILLMQLGVQFWLSKQFRTWGEVANGSHKTGMQVADTIFEETDLEPVPIERTGQPLSDHYDPGDNVVRLSPPVANKATVAAQAVTAHELGHVEQYQEGSALITVRSLLVPFIRFSPVVFYLSWLLGFVFNMTNMIWVGMLFFGIQVLFSLITLPVEFNASKRGIHNLEISGLLVTDEDREGSKKVLRAAALTYVAAGIGAVMQFFYFMSVARAEAEHQRAQDERKSQRAAGATAKPKPGTRASAKQQARGGNARQRSRGGGAKR